MKNEIYYLKIYNEIKNNLNFINNFIYFNNHLFFDNEHFILLSKIIASNFNKKESILIIDETNDKKIITNLKTFFLNQNNKIYFFNKETKNITLDFLSFTINQVKKIDYAILIKKNGNFYKIIILRAKGNDFFSIEKNFATYKNFQKSSLETKKQDNNNIFHFLDLELIKIDFYEEIIISKKINIASKEIKVGVLTYSNFISDFFKKYFYNTKAINNINIIDKKNIQKLSTYFLKKHFKKNNLDFLIFIDEFGFKTDFIFRHKNKISIIKDHEIASIYLFNIIKILKRQNKNLIDYCIYKNDLNNNYISDIANNYKLKIANKKIAKKINLLVCLENFENYKIDLNNIKMPSAIEYAINIFEIFKYFYHEQKTFIDLLKQLQKNLGLYLIEKLTQKTTFNSFLKNLENFKQKFIHAEKVFEEKNQNSFFTKFNLGDRSIASFFYKNNFLKIDIEIYSKNQNAANWEIKKIIKIFQNKYL